MKLRAINLRWGDINMSKLDLHKLIVHFAQSNKAEGKPPITVTRYREVLNDFIRFLESADRRPILADLNVINVREFIIHEQVRPISNYTV